MKERLLRLFQPKSLAILSAVLLGISLVPLFVLARFDHPCSDDYNYGLYVSQAVCSGGSFWDVLAAAAQKTGETYQNWQGSFSAVFLMALQPAAFGEGWYILTPFLMMGSLIFSTFFFLRTVCVFRLKMPTSHWVILSCVICFFSIHFSPSAFEGFFWFNGALYYTFFHALSLCLYAFVLKFLNAPARGSFAAALAAAAILSFLVGGGNYPTALLTLLVLLGAAAFAFWKRLPLSRKLGTLLCLLLEGTSFLISILAPGNSVRQDYFTVRPGPAEAILRALTEAVRAVLEHTTVPMLLALLALCPVFYRCAARLSFRFPLPILAPLAAVCLLGVEMTPPIYAMNGTGASRMKDLYYDAYCLLAAAVVFYLMGWAAHRLSKPGKKRWEQLRPGFVAGLAALFLISLLCLPDLKSLSGVSAFLSLKNGEAQLYHQQRTAQLEQYWDPQVKDVILEPLTARPALLLPKAVPVESTDPENIVNQRAAAYFNKNSVTSKGS